MRKPSLSLETFAAALAVLGAASGCAKEERALPESPPPAAAAPQTQPLGAAADQPAATTTPSVPADGKPTESGAAAAAAAAPAVQPANAPVVGRAVEGAKKKDALKPGAAAGSKQVNAACGAGTCTDDMKKGNGN